MAKAIMIQGAGSNVGKSLFVAGLARHFAGQGLRVVPFKPQNMSNNAAVTDDGGEIGRAQALQARAAGVAASVHMNPVLLKPQSDTGAQVIVQGQRYATLGARDFGSHRAALMPRILESLARVAEDADLVLVEGAGSPAETNLRRGDLANMGFAEAADMPVVLLGDIDRGGVIAQLVGTHAVLSEADRNRIKGFVINKFRGDVELFRAGNDEIARRTGWAALGVLPWFAGAGRLPAEDILDLRGASRPDGLTIAVPRLGRIANFDDLDPLAAEPGLSVRIIEPGQPLPGDAALVLIPGSKSTIADLAAFRANGWDIDLAAHVRRGGHVLGVCGGYQMLGRTIADPDGIEGAPGTVEGLGLLDVHSVMRPQKTLRLQDATHPASGAALAGYEIHIGETTGPDTGRGWLRVGDRPEGAADASGRIRGTYLHGLFGSDAFRAACLAELGAESGLADFDAGVDAALDGLAAHIAQHIDCAAILAMAEDLNPTATRST